MCESVGHQPIWGRCPAPSLNINQKLLAFATIQLQTRQTTSLFQFYSSRMTKNKKSINRDFVVSPPLVSLLDLENSLRLSDCGFEKIKP